METRTQTRRFRLQSNPRRWYRPRGTASLVRINQVIWSDGPAYAAQRLRRLEEREEWCWQYEEQCRQREDHAATWLRIGKLLVVFAAFSALVTVWALHTRGGAS